MDIDLYIEERKRIKGNTYPLLARFIGGQVWLVVSATQGVLVDDPKGYRERGYFSNTLDFECTMKNWEILPPGSSVTFLEE